MSPRTGRPIVGVEPKDKQIAFRVSNSTVKKFSECAELSGKNKIELFEMMVNDLHEKLTKEK